jgi:dTDP-glucose 4,6-dehydratase
LKILVTGGAGFIGSHFVDLVLLKPEISKEIQEVCVIDKLSYASRIDNLKLVFNNPKLKFIKGDICDINFLDSIESKFDWIINFAAESHVDNSLKFPQKFVESNVLGAVQVLEFARKNISTKVIQISTDEVYGSVESISFTESDHLCPSSPYSASKASAEMFCKSYITSYQMDIRISRSSNNFGSRQHSEKLIPTIINSIKSNRPVPVYGSGLNIRDWIYVEDNCLGIWSLMTLGKPCGIYNLGGGNEITNLDLINKIGLIMNKSTPKIHFVEDRKGHDFRYSINIDKSKNELNFTPVTNFEDNLARTIESYLT